MSKLDKLSGLKGKKILITGASGYLGQEIVSTLYDLDVLLYVTDVPKKHYQSSIKINIQNY